MTERVFVKVAGAVLLLGAAFAAPTRAQSVPASFDCAKAGKAVEKFICSHAMLRWQDLALSRSYRAARNAVAGAARDRVLAGQRDWVRERDRHCIADRTFKNLSPPSTALRTQAYGCLNSIYISRRRALQDLAAAPLLPRDIQEIDLKPIAAARPDIVEGGAMRVFAIRLSPDAAQAAIWSRESIGEEDATAVYAATIDAFRRLDQAPDDIRALLDKAGRSDTVREDEVPERDGGGPDVVRGNHHFLVWAADLGHGTIELKMRKRAARAPLYLVAWGSRSLCRYLFDADRSQLVYAADTGISVFDMTRHDERRIAGTSAGDQPSAVSADRRLFVWSTRNRCGDEFLAEQDEDAPERFCLARLAKPEVGK